MPLPLQLLAQDQSLAQLPLPPGLLLRDHWRLLSLLQQLAQDRPLERLPLLPGLRLPLQQLAKDQPLERLPLLPGLPLLEHSPGPLRPPQRLWPPGRVLPRLRAPGGG